MNLLIRISGGELPEWEGYHFRVNPLSGGDGIAALCTWDGGRWKKVQEVPYRHGVNGVEVALPQDSMQEDNREIDVEFKWFDHMPEPLDMLDFQDHGDTAPNSRFRYYYRYEQ
jgi:hypothetical protein